jgi:hypothetical protein
MALTIPEIKSAPSGPPVDAGTHRAVLYGVVDLGHQHSKDFSGNPEIQHQVLLMFELPDERLDDGRPRAMSRQVKLSVHEKATLRHAIHALLGKSITDEQAMKVQLADLIGKNCLLSVVQKPGKDGRTMYANIDKFAPLMKGMTPAEPENNYTFFEINPGESIAADLPKWVREKIEKSVEFVGSAPITSAPIQTRSPSVPGTEELDESQIPF